MDFFRRAVVSDDSIVKKEFPLVGQILSLLVALISLPVLAFCFYQRLVEARRKRYCWASITLLASYLASASYIFAMTILIHPDFKRNPDACDATLLTCLTLYVLAKAFGVAFLIERAYIISWPMKPRHRTLEYVLTSVCVFVPWFAAAVLCITYRMSMFSEQGICVIGLKMWTLAFLTAAEVGSYLYLTLRFLYPLISVHLGGNGLLLPLKGLVIRTVIGTAITTLTTLGVKIMLMMFNGEPAWLCCMTCKYDAFLGALILHWMTKAEHNDPPPPESPQALGIVDENLRTPTSEGSTSEKGGYVPSQKEVSLRDIL